MDFFKLGNRLLIEYFQEKDSLGIKIFEELVLLNLNENIMLLGNR